MKKFRWNQQELEGQEREVEGGQEKEQGEEDMTSDEKSFLLQSLIFSRKEKESLDDETAGDTFDYTSLT
jgi:hypothetical protein